MKQSDPIKIDGIYYRLNHDNKTAEVTSCNYEEYTGSIVIPQSILFNGESYSVTMIGESAFYYCLELASVIIPITVTSIDNCAFECCSGLYSVVIPSSIVSIGVQAFKGCSKLNSVIIPNSVVSIGAQAFKGCSRLSSVIISNSVVSIGERAFEYCTGLHSYLYHVLSLSSAAVLSKDAPN